jgi:hypothetical protein
MKTKYTDIFEMVITKGLKCEIEGTQVEGVRGGRGGVKRQYL